MASFGKGLWDDQGFVIATLLPNGQAIDLGSATSPFRNLYLSGDVFVSASGTKSGTVTLNGTTPVSVSQTGVTSGSVISFTLKTVGGTVGAYPVVKTITPSTGFTVIGTASDTSTYNYIISDRV